MVRRIILICFTTVVVVGCYPISGVSGKEGIQSYRTLRYRDVVGQTDWFTCGPAAVATLLNLYRVDSVETEHPLLKLAMQLQPNHADGFNLLTLKQLLRTRQLESEAYRLFPGQLRDYFLSGALPILVHVTKPMAHYVVLVGFVEQDMVVILDPSWGRQVVRFDLFVSDRGFEGTTLIPMPDHSSLAVARSEQLRLIQWASDRLEKLRSIAL